MQRSNHLICDTPGCGAFVSLDHLWARSWETLTGDEGLAAHLCPRCAEKRADGVLADPLHLRCVRCERTTADGIARWWAVPADEQARTTPPGARPHQVSVCDDCKLDSDSFRI